MWNISFEMNIFKIKKEERWLALVAFLIIAALNSMLIYHYSPLFLRGGRLGFWSIFFKHFCVSGYDCWSYIAISNLRIFFEAARHPLFFSILYPMYLLNHWLMFETGTNYAVFMMAALITFCSVYSLLFLYRIFKNVMDLGIVDSLLLTILFMGFGHIMLAMMVPDHFAISLFLLTMTLYLAGMKMKQGRPFKLWQTALLFFLTAGVTLSNGVKTLIAALFVNGKKVFYPKFIVFSVVLPLALMFSIYWYQYNAFEVPQKAAVHKIENSVKKKVGETTLKKRVEKREKWKSTHLGKPVCDVPLLRMTDMTTSRVGTVVENFFGESIQLHQDYLLQDGSYTRPVFVKYSAAYNYIIEGIVVFVFFVGLWRGRRSRFLCMCMSWFAIDLLLHIVLGFAINEVYIMSADWIFIIPISFAVLLKFLNKEFLPYMRFLIVFLSAYLWIYNGYLVTSYFLV